MRGSLGIRVLKTGTGMHSPMLFKKHCAYFSTQLHAVVQGRSQGTGMQSPMLYKEHCARFSTHTLKACCTLLTTHPNVHLECVLPQNNCMSPPIYPSMKILMEALRRCISEISPLLHCQTLPSPHINNFAEYQVSAWVCSGSSGV
jgi:hypothetical protein